MNQEKWDACCYSALWHWLHTRVECIWRCTNEKDCGFIEPLTSCRTETNLAEVLIYHYDKELDQSPNPLFSMKVLQRCVSFIMGINLPRPEVRGKRWAELKIDAVKLMFIKLCTFLKKDFWENQICHKHKNWLCCYVELYSRVWLNPMKQKQILWIFLNILLSFKNLTSSQQ